MVALSLMVLSARPTFTILAPPRGARSASASAVSDDGRVVYGKAWFGGAEGTARPCRWIDGWAETLPIPEKIDFGAESIEMADTVGDGRIAVGTVPTAKSFRACRWRDGKIELLPLIGGIASATANAVAQDGTVVGATQLRGQWRTVMWRSGKATILPYPPGRSGLMVPRAISADGRTVVGEIDAVSGTGRGAWEWKAGQGVRVMQDGELFRKLPCGISADGRTRLLLHEGAEGEAGTTVLERPTSFVYPDPKGTVARSFSYPRMDASGTALVLNVIRSTDGMRSSWLWRERTGAREIKALLGAAMPQGAVVSSLSGVARAAGGRVVVIARLEDGRAFLASVP